MDEEELDRSMTPVTPEVAKLKGGMRRNSTGNTISRGSLFSSSRFGKIQPRYLMPSTGSCHDLCKYGRKDAIDAKGEYPFRRRSLWKHITTDKERNQSETLKLRERSMKMVIKSGLLPPLKFQLSDEPNKKALVCSKVTGSHEKLVNVNLETPLPTMIDIVSAEQTIMPTSSDNEVNQLRVLKMDGPKRQMTELNTAVQQKNLPEKLEIRKMNDTLPANDVDVLGEPIMHNRDNISLVRKSAASVSPKVIKQKVLSSINKSIPSAHSKVQKGKASPSASKFIPSGKFGGFKRKASASVRADLSIKYALPLKRKAPVVKHISLLDPSQGLNSQRKHEPQITRTLSMTEKRKKKIVKSMPAYISTKSPGNGVLSMKQRNYKNATIASLNKNQERHGKAENTGADSKAKVLDVVEQKSGNIELDPIQQESKKCKSQFSDPNESVSEENVTEGKLESSIGEDKRRHRRTTIVHGAESFSKPQKLKFRRGKVVDLQLENTGPRRLRFRKGRVLGDSKEKVLGVVEQKSGNIELDPIQQESKDGKSEFSDSNESVPEENMTEGKLEPSIGDEKKRHRRTTTVHGVESFSKPQKLRFRRGKVVDLQLENTGPRRLRFRKGRVLGENSNGSGEVQKRIVTKELATPVLDDPVLETETVMLRHQDTQEKKDSQCLFNHVIEETATKLVETRKSKVKALVGAFETVISLQEIKPAQSELAIH